MNGWVIFILCALMTLGGCVSAAPEVDKTVAEPFIYNKELRIVCIPYYGSHAYSHMTCMQLSTQDELDTWVETYGNNDAMK
jgi:hypothetical protein